MDNTLGTIEPGKQADMIVLDKNPLLNLKYLKNVSMVIKDGKTVKGKLKKNKEIDQLLDSII